tara:strand:+ start:1876 stop:2289 length:414 start_codon:yes stop_codon:yes gene_type:complete
MRFETTADIERERKAIKAFVRIFKGSFEKLGDNDIDYKIFNEAGELIGYTEIKGRHCNMNKAFPLPVAARKLVKLSDKRLNPIMIWACNDGLIYSPVRILKGEIMWGGRPPREGAVNDQELMAYFKFNKSFKYVKYY